MTKLTTGPEPVRTRRRLCLGADGIGGKGATVGLWPGELRPRTQLEIGPEEGKWHDELMISSEGA